MLHRESVCWVSHWWGGLAISWVPIQIKGEAAGEGPPEEVGAKRDGAGQMMPVLCTGLPALGACTDIRLQAWLQLLHRACQAVPRLL